MTIEQLIRESNLIEGFNDPEFDAQGLIAWDYLQSQDKLTFGTINKVQKILTLKQTDLNPDQRGYLRSIPVYIGSRSNGYVEAMKPLFIEAALRVWIQHEPDMPAKHAHILYESIHPHVDGNGRTGRLLMWWRESKRGYNFTAITNAKKHEKYYPWFKPGYME